MDLKAEVWLPERDTARNGNDRLVQRRLHPVDTEYTWVNPRPSFTG